MIPKFKARHNFSGAPYLTSYYIPSPFSRLAAQRICQPVQPLGQADRCKAIPFDQIRL